LLLQRTIKKRIYQFVVRLSQKSIATRTLLIKLIERGWNFADLASKCGVDQRYIENQVSSNFTCERARLLVERVFEVPIFSTLEEFTRAAEQKNLFGFDPRLASVDELLQFAIERGFPAPTNLRKKPLIESLAALLAVKSKTNSTGKKNYAAKTESAPTESRQFKITGFNPQPVRELLAKYEDCVQEIEETANLQEQLRGEVARLQKKTKFSDKKALEILTTRKTQLDMCPNKIAELEERLAEIENEMSVIRTGGDAGGLNHALHRLLDFDEQRLKTEMVSALLPIIGSEEESIKIVLESNRYVGLRKTIWSWNARPNAQALEHGLKILEYYDASGRLENFGSRNAAKTEKPAVLTV
jgi:hypothetical protein